MGEYDQGGLWRWMVRDRVGKLLELIESAGNELKAIRQACPHSQHEMGWYSWRIGSMGPARLCVACLGNVGPPSQDEINQFMKDQKAMQHKFLVETYGQEEADRVERECPIIDSWSRDIV